MSVPLTLVLALPSVAALTRTHLIAPDPAVLLCEHIWYLEDEIEKIWVDESHPDHQDVRDNPEGTQEFMVSSIEFHAMRLWKGEQVDGTVLRSWARAYEEWGLDPTEGGSMPGSFILKRAKCGDGRLEIPHVAQVDAAVHAISHARGFV